VIVKVVETSKLYAFHSRCVTVLC